MKSERIIKFCEKEIAREQIVIGGANSDKIEAYQMVVEYIKSGDNAKGTEVEEIKALFDIQFEGHIKKIRNSKNPIKYNWTSKEENAIKLKLIPMIKKVIGENEEEFDRVTVVKFFEAFILKLPQWWRDNNFNITAIVRHFDKIYTQIITSKDGSGNGSNHHNSKPTVSDMMSDLKFNSETDSE